MTGKARYVPRRPVLPICAPFIDSASSDDIPAQPPPQPLTRVLHSHAFKAIEPAPLEPLATTREIRSRKSNAVGRRTRGVVKATETAKAVATRKVSPKTPQAQSKLRALKARGS